MFSSRISVHCLLDINTDLVVDKSIWLLQNIEEIVLHIILTIDTD
jgi:hypothetical protein